MTTVGVRSGTAGPRRAHPGIPDLVHGFRGSRPQLAWLPEDLHRTLADIHLTYAPLVPVAGRPPQMQPPVVAA
ncbi:hypothetical protein [Streptomyces lydicus]|uniref:hypothetical protein n=1 Tax=Streptomyces lydicus TaxID=47763 RepID=UPI001012C228|nr:hypothetical protein [Streptomyces lydicus]MCZ1006972.1 hypothetical protein [Streptomyces lydicus]